MKQARYAMIILLLVAMVGMASATLILSKSPATQTVPYGGMATFTITLYNMGTTPVDRVAVFDAAAPDCQRTIGLLGAEQSTTYTCQMGPLYVNQQNVAQAAGYTVVIPPDTPQYVESNVASVNVLVGPAPSYSIDIEKLPVTQEVYYGDTATFQINVENTGTGELRNVRVFDSAAPNCAKILGNMPPGARASYTCEMPNVVRNIQNVATVQGTKPTGGTVQDTASAIVYMVPCTSRIGVSINPEQQTVEYGGTASWKVIVANLGTCRLRDVQVLEAATTVVVPQGCAKKIGTMPGGTSQTYDCSVSGVTYPFAKMLLATGLDPYGAKMEDTDVGTVEVIPCNPAVSIVGTPAAQFVHSGGTARWSITVTNTGDKDLTGVAVSGTVCKKTIGSLAVGAKSTYTCSKGGYIRGTRNNMYTYVLTAKGTACTMTPTAKDTLWVTVKP